MSASEIAGQLKIWPGDLDEIKQGKKRADIRRCDDRTFRVGQVWELLPWDPESSRYITLRGVYIRITHVERMAGPLLIYGSWRRNWQPVPLVVLSFELAANV